MLTWKDVIQFATDDNLEPDFRVERTEAEWALLLADGVYRITRLKGTEPSFTSELCHIYEPGIYECVCCGAQLFDSTIKFDSGTGWPSFSQPIQENAIKYSIDQSLLMMRVEAMCNVCDCHLGHVFPDGPEPSGLRYCINSASIKLSSKK